MDRFDGRRAEIDAAERKSNGSKWISEWQRKAQARLNPATVEWLHHHGSQLDGLRSWQIATYDRVSNSHC
jgi:hypothetical protein